MSRRGTTLWSLLLSGSLIAQVVAQHRQDPHVTGVLTAFAVGLGAVLATELVSTPLHELSHALVGRLLGLQVATFSFGYGELRRVATLGRTTVEVRHHVNRAASVRFVASVAGWRGVLVNAAGPGLHGAAALAVLALGDPWTSTPRFAVLLMSVALAVRNLLPVPAASGTPSDESTIIGLLRGQQKTAATP